MTRRNIMMIVGCHRSGTSALTGALSHLGWQEPKTLIGESRWNQKGYFESPQIRDFHDALLAQIDRPVFDRRDTPENVDFKELMETHFKEMQTLLDDEFGSAEQILIKDPRLCRLLPLWAEYVAKTGDDLRIALAVRHPLEVAKSLHKRNTFPLEEGHLIWLRETILALRNTRALPVSVLRYDSLLENWSSAIDQMFSELHVYCTPPDEATTAQITEFLSPDLRRQVAKDSPKSEAGWAEELALNIYTSLGQAYAPVAFDLIIALYNTAIAAFTDKVAYPGPEAQQAYDALQPSMRRLVPYVLSAGRSVPPAADLHQAIERTFAAEQAHQDGQLEVAMLHDKLAEMQEAKDLLEIELQGVRLQMRHRAAEVALLLQQLDSQSS